MLVFRIRGVKNRIKNPLAVAQIYSERTNERTLQAEGRRQWKGKGREVNVFLKMFNKHLRSSNTQPCFFTYCCCWLLVVVIVHYLGAKGVYVHEC